MDLAASVQAVTEEIVIRLARSVKKDTGAKNICLAGGVALNCVANGKLLRENIFDGIWVQPAAGDAGGAVGAAYAAYHGFMGQPRKLNGHMDGMAGSYLGPVFGDDEIAERLTKAGAKFTRLTHEQMIERTAQALADEKAVGWMQGRMEFGPRSLGARSILGDARSPSMQKTLNLKVKYAIVPTLRAGGAARRRRQVFRHPHRQPLHADGGAGGREPPSRHDRRGRGAVRHRQAERAALGHSGGDAHRLLRPHPDRAQGNQPDFHDLISAFKAKTGSSVVVNTSFNVRGEPIVCTPEDAWRCFMGSEIEVLVIGNCFLRKEDQDPALKLDYKNAFELD